MEGIEGQDTTQEGLEDWKNNAYTRRVRSVYVKRLESLKDELVNAGIAGSEKRIATLSGQIVELRGFVMSLEGKR